METSISPELLSVLACPENKQPVSLADGATLDKLNQQIASGSLRNRAGKTVTDKLEAGLLRTDAKRLYPVRDGIPIMLIDEAIDL